MLSLFILCIDDLVIKANKLYAFHRVLYKITTTESGSTYFNIEMHCDRAAGTIATSMKEYMDKMLHRFDTRGGTHTTKSSKIYQPPSYGLKQQFTDPGDRSKSLSPTDVDTLQ